MKSRILAAIAALALVPAVASATATPSFTASPSRALQVTFDASASTCTNGPCGYTWTYQSANHLGVTMGHTQVLTYKFPAEGVYTVTLKLSDRCAPGSSTWCWKTLSKQVTVTGPTPVS